ncbi:MAG: RagB/SusD family nutrient uptake outer membrane protein [Odoribacter sp.]
MKLKNKITIVVILLTSIFYSCSDWLNVQPNDKQTDTQLLATKGGFYSALNGVYTNLASNALYGRNLSYEMLDVIAKRYNPNTTNTYLTQLNAFTYADNSVASQIEATWKMAYSTILNCNVILKNVEDKKGTVLNDQDYKIMKGELLALRAFLHFDMLRIFGPVYKNKPQALSIPYNENYKAASLPLLPADSIINDKILRDLNTAESLLSVDPVITEGPMANTLEDNEDNSGRYRQLRFNYYAVLALKARVLLYKGDNEAALTAAKKIIEDPIAMGHFPHIDPSKLLANSTTPDRMFSTEVFFGYYKKDRSLIYKNSFNGENAGSNLLQPRTGFVDGSLFAGETQDFRFQSQWATSSAVGISGYMFVKYKEIVDPDFKLFYGTFVSLIKLSEVYYIAAEAETDVAKSYKYLNDMRKVRGLTELPVGTRPDLETKLRTEYLREFLGEGQIFFMYKRLYSKILKKENGYNTSTYGASEARYVLPLPVSEIENR